MNKLVRESINFERTGNVKKSLGLGYESVIRKFFNDLDVPDEDYTVEPNGGIFVEELHLSNLNITWLPDNLTINSYLDLTNSKIDKLPDKLLINGSLYLQYSKIDKLPNNLTVNGALYLIGTGITELPDDLIVGDDINVEDSNIKLINFIENSKFKKQLNIWDDA